MSKINIERTIFGSLTKSIGDDTIAYSNGSSKEAEIFRTLFDSDANKKMATNYASLFFYWSPISKCHTFLHIQGGYIEFKADGRSFCTRGIYEISSKDMESIKYDYLSVIDSIPRLSRMEKVEYGINPETIINSVRYKEEKLDNNEKLLLGLLYSAILNNKKLFIKIKAIDDEYKDNNVLSNPKLRSILKIVSLLPSRLAQYASVAFSVDAVVCKMLNGILNPLIIAHQDDITNWHDKDMLIANWEETTLQSETTKDYNFSEEERIVKEIAKLPLLGSYMETYKDKQFKVFSWVSNIRQHLDAAIDNRDVNNNDIALLNLAYMGCEDQTAYRHEAMASKLFDLIIKNNGGITAPKETMAKIEKEYHLSSKRPIGKKYYEEEINKAENLYDIEQVLEQIDCTDEIKNVVVRKVCSDWIYIEDTIDNCEKYKRVSNLCQVCIHEKIVNDGLEKVLKYYDSSYVGINIEDVKSRIVNWQGLYDACEVVGWGYATTFVDGKIWGILDVSDFNKWYNMISPRIDFDKQPMVFKLFADQLNDLLRDKSLSSCCDVILQLNSTIVFDISSIKPKELGENAKKKLNKIREQKADYYESLNNKYESLTRQQTKEQLKDGNTDKPYNDSILQKFSDGGAVISFIRKYYLDNLLTAVLTVVIVFFCYPQICPNLPITENTIELLPFENNEEVNASNTDTIFFDADLNQNKISRGLLLRLTESILTRLGKRIDIRSAHPSICLYGDSVYTFPLINTPNGDLVKIDSLLFGKSLVSTSGQSKRNDSIVIVSNGELRTAVLNGNHRLLSQLRHDVLTVNEIRIDTLTLLLPNNSFRDKYGVEPNSNHLLYYLFLVNEMEHFKRNKSINFELSY